ncbi:MAG: GTP-binding protein, partial [Acutalibacteraceae bacterium]
MKRKINIGVLAHVDAGKTSLTEQLLFYGGALRSAGAVDLGTAQTDTLAVERTRGISVKTADAVLETETAVVNLIDTPGHADFISEVERALSVLDCAVLVISAVEGVQAQTEVLLGAVQRLKLPCVAFVNKLDRAGSDFEAACAALSDLLAGRTLLVVNRPEHEGLPEAAPVRAADCLENAVVLAEVEALLERYLAGGAVDFP